MKPATMDEMIKSVKNSMDCDYLLNMTHPYRFHYFSSYSNRDVQSKVRLQLKNIGPVEFGLCFPVEDYVVNYVENKRYGVI